MMKAHVSNSSKLQQEILLFNFAFNFNLCRYDVMEADQAELRAQLEGMESDQREPATLFITALRDAPRARPPASSLPRISMEDLRACGGADDDLLGFGGYGAVRRKR
jgi:hypothetical protein